MGPPGGEGRQYGGQGLRINFDVKMTRTSTPSTCTVEAYNLNPSSVALAQEPDTVIELWVGYSLPRLVFRGNPTRNGVRVETRGPDRVLHIEAQDGARAYESARLNISYATQVTLVEVVDEVARQLGLPRGTIRVDEDFVFVNGVTLVGPARDILDRLALSTASDWMVRDGAMVFIGKDEDTGEQAVVFSSTNGNLLGRPSPTDRGIEVTGLIEPSMRPGKVFRVESRDYTGEYTATDVNFRGDSGYANDFIVVVRGTPRS